MTKRGPKGLFTRPSFLTGTNFLALLVELVKGKIIFEKEICYLYNNDSHLLTRSLYILPGHGVLNFQVMFWSLLRIKALTGFHPETPSPLVRRRVREILRFPDGD